METERERYFYDPPFECREDREKHKTIELSHVENSTLPKYMLDAGFVYRPIDIDEYKMSPILKEKLDKAIRICGDTKTIEIKESNAKSKSKTTKKKNKKVPSKLH